MPLGQAYLDRSTLPGITKAQGVFAGGGAAANCTQAGPINGVVSVTYNAATGRYLITFADVGGIIVGDGCKVARAQGAVPLFVNLVHSTFSQANKTVEIDVRTEAALTDLATTDRLYVNVNFAPNPQNS